MASPRLTCLITVKDLIILVTKVCNYYLLSNLLSQKTKQAVIIQTWLEKSAGN